MIAVQSGTLLRALQVLLKRRPAEEGATMSATQKKTSRGGATINSLGRSRRRVAHPWEQLRGPICVQASVWKRLWLPKSQCHRKPCACEPFSERRVSRLDWGQRKHPRVGQWLGREHSRALLRVVLGNHSMIFPFHWTAERGYVAMWTLPVALTLSLAPFWASGRKGIATSTSSSLHWILCELAKIGTRNDRAPKWNRSQYISRKWIHISALE
jgi:hypothetical protein